METLNFAIPTLFGLEAWLRMSCAAWGWTRCGRKMAASSAPAGPATSRGWI